MNLPIAAVSLALALCASAAPRPATSSSGRLDRSAWRCPSGAISPAVSQGQKTPESSSLFMRHVDPESGVESWVLKPGLFAHHQQACYFTQKSMTDDGRFLFFWANDSEFGPHPETNRLGRTGLVDFKTDTVVDLGIRAQTPFLDVKTDQLWYFSDTAADDEASRRICRRDLLVDPLKEIVVCDIPEVLLRDVKKVHYAFPGDPTGEDMQYFSTHPTLTSDRKKMFISAHVGDRYEQGFINLETGAWESWGTTPFFANHDQLNPVRDDIALLAWERCWTSPDALEYKRKTGWYPRMWLAYPDGRREMQPNRAPKRNYASHEHWSEDGKGFYWCANGVYYQDLATGRQELVVPWRASHATISADNRFVTFDCPVGKSYRGCSWQVGFWNRDTGRGLYIHSRRPKLCDNDGAWHNHPDPHPAFVCGDRYVVCTMNGEDSRMNLSLTPVAPLVGRTVSGEAALPCGGLCGAQETAAHVPSRRMPPPAVERIRINP